MKEREKTMIQRLRDLELNDHIEFDLRRKISVINTIQRLRCEGYVIITKTFFNKGIFMAIKKKNPDKAIQSL